MANFKEFSRGNKVYINSQTEQAVTDGERRFISENQRRYGCTSRLEGSDYDSFNATHDLFGFGVINETCVGSSGGYEA